jgi:hypothetical protein
MNFIALASAYASEPISLTIRPACGVPGDFSYSTDCTSLLRLLRRETELRSAVLERFQKELAMTKSARLHGVEMSERALTQIGYFVE